MEETRVLEGDKVIASIAEAGLTVHGKVVRVVLVASGSLSVGLGVLGMVLPVLPTTPFLLLAAACYLRSSRRLHRWLLSNRLFGGYLRRYLSGEGLPLAAKVSTIAMLWLSLGASALYAVPARLWWVRLILLAVGVGVSVHLLSIRTSGKGA
jgi:hypothetical protein